MLRVVVVLLALFILEGCVAQRPSGSTEPAYTVKEFNAPLDVALDAGTGDSIFMEGSYVDGEYIEVPQSVDIMIPGSMMIPFPVHIAQGRLELSAFYDGWKYYCGDLSKSAASFPGLGSVVSRGDCIGIRIPVGGGSPEWVVDNSNHNGFETIWSRRISAEEAKEYQPQKSSTPFAIRQLTQVTFDGYFGGQLHFTLKKEGDQQEAREFVFDFSGEPTIVGFQGKHLEVLQASNVGIKYRWKKL